MQKTTALRKKIRCAHGLQHGVKVLFSQQQIRCIMRASVGVLSIFLFTMQVLLAGKGHAQGMSEKEITIGFQRTSLSGALKKIEDLSGFRIAYSLEDVEKYTAITLEKGTRSMEKTLSLILSNTNLGFRQQG